MAGEGLMADTACGAMLPAPEKPAMAYVICCNDSIEGVVLGDEAKAEAEKERLAAADWELVQRQGNRHWASEREYRDVHYWHLHSVPVT